MPIITSLGGSEKAPALASLRAAGIDLDPQHYRKLAGSGLTLDSLLRIRAYTERDLGRLYALLGTPLVTVPALVFPGWDAYGQPNGYAVARFDPPAPKYLCPTGVPCRPYFPPFPVLWDALKTPGSLIGGAEGIAKAVALCQAGIPTIGFMSLSNALTKGPPGDEARYYLLYELAAIDWRDRPIPIFMDADPVRKPMVHWAACILAQLFSEAGGRPYLPLLPPGPPDEAGRPTKNAPDDLYASLIQCQGLPLADTALVRQRPCAFAPAIATPFSPAALSARTEKPLAA
jgi:hypothetical protein